MKYRKTSQKATIVQHLCNRRTVIERRIYEDDVGREFVRVNGEYIDIVHYYCDDHYEVYRY